MARGFSNALRIALGGVAGGLEGYGEKQERLAKASLLKQQQERQAEQDAINLAKSLVDMGFRPDFGEDDAIASSMPIPRQSTRLDTTLPTFGAGLAPAMERTRRESFGITPERPVAQPKPLVSALTQAEQVQPPRPRTGDKTLNVPGIGSMRMKRPETDEEKANRVLESYREQRKVDAEIAAQKAQTEKEATEATANSLADLMVRTYRTSDGKPLTRDAALVAARFEKTPAEMGLVEKPMTEAERKELGLAWAKFKFEKTKPTPQRMSAKAEEVASTTTPMSAEDRAFVAQFMPTPRRDATGKVIGYDPPRKRLGGMRALASTVAGFGGTLGEAAYDVAGSDAQRLSTIINAQADRQALREQGGRLSDRDIVNKRNEVNIRMGDTRNLPVLSTKLSKVLSWAEAETSPPPPSRETATQASGVSAATDPVYQNALDAIRRGAPQAAVIERYEKATNKKWPGGV